MDDFLKDRPIVTAAEATIFAPTAVPVSGGGGGPFARIVREAAVVPANRTPAAAAAKPGATGKPAAADAAHTTQVKTVVENGRIARLVVTCSCGKVTEIACQY